MYRKEKAQHENKRKKMEIVELKSIFDMKIHWRDFTEVWSADKGSLNLKVHQIVPKTLRKKTEKVNWDSTICRTLLSILKYM